jgi:hypothetical protein
VWQIDFRDQGQFDIQNGEGYINFLTEVVGRRSWAKYLPGELVPIFILSELHTPSVQEAHQLSNGQHSAWVRSDIYRRKYHDIHNWAIRQAFIFDLIIHEHRLVSPDAISFWSAPVSARFPNLSRFAAVLAHLSRRLGDGLARSPAAIAANADAIAQWFRHEVTPRFPHLAILATVPIRSPKAQPKSPERRGGPRPELRNWGISYLPGDSTEVIDLLVIGPIAAQSGLGTGARRSIDALNHTQCKFRTLHFAYDNPSAMAGARDHTEYRGENPRAVLWHYNGEYLPGCMRILDIFTHGRYNIAYFVWETEVMPKAH